MGTLESSSSTPKDLFYALGVNGILKCSSKEETFEVFFSSSITVWILLLWLNRMWKLANVFLFYFKGIISSLQAVVRDANSLLDFYYSIGSLRLIKVKFIIWFSLELDFHYHFYSSIFIVLFFCVHVMYLEFSHFFLVQCL